MRAAAGTSAEGADLTVAFEVGQNSDANFAHLAQAGLSYVGSVPAGDCPDLLVLPAADRTLVDKDRFGGLTACDTRRTRTVTLGYLGVTQIAAGGVEEACGTWVKVLDAMEEGIYSSRARQAVVDMRTLLSPYRHRRISVVARG